MRQPTKLILRIEGRTPNDDAAAFTIKFAGSFEPMQAVAENSESEMPEVKSENQSNVHVNSVGTIIEVKPKPISPPKEAVAKSGAKQKRKKTTGVEENKQVAKEKEVVAAEIQPSKADDKVDTTEEKKEQPLEKSEAETEKKTPPQVIVTDNISKQDVAKTDIEKPSEETKEKSAEKTVETPAKNIPENSAETAAKLKSRNKIKKAKEPNPLENVHLIILLKDGTRIERAMSDVTKVGVDKGVLTVIANDGSIRRYSILDVAKMTIE